MSDRGTFIDLCLQGVASPSEIDDFVDRWHDAPEKSELHDFLGMTKTEYSLWVRVPDALSIILKSRREAKSLAAAISDDLRQAGPAADRFPLARLRDWLKAQGQLI